jgi:hypothetical protein
MFKLTIIVFVGFSLGACAMTNSGNLAQLQRDSLARDGLGADSNGSNPGPAHRKLAAKNHTDPASSMASMQDDDAALATVPKYSKEWVALYAEKQKREDAKLDRAMIICSGCLTTSAH